jgi:Flp pilus assembly protein TadD
MRIFNQARFGDWAEVLRRVDFALDPLVRRHPEQDVAVARRALQAGSAQRAAGRIDQAETAYRVALTLAPDWAPAHCELGNLMCEQGNINEAETAYRQALCLQPDMAQAASSLAQLLVEQGRRQEADVYARRVVTEHD